MEILITFKKLYNNFMVAETILTLALVVLVFAIVWLALRFMR